MEGLLDAERATNQRLNTDAGQLNVSAGRLDGFNVCWGGEGGREGATSGG